jgi:type I restriction enzyme S subunit
MSGELGHDVLSVTQKGLRVKDLENNEGQHSMDYSKYQLVFKDDFVMNHMDLLTGYVDLSKQPGVTSPDYRVFTKSGEKVHNQYYLFLFQLCYTQRIFYGLGRGVSNMGRWRLPSVEFLNMFLPLPSYPEQQQIVDCLDEQTQLIDKKITTEEKRIELLKEYRQSLVSEVVTGKKRVVH